MRIATATLTGISPYSQSRWYEKEAPREGRGTGVKTESAAWRGVAGRGRAQQGTAWHGKTRQGHYCEGHSGYVSDWRVRGGSRASWQGASGQGGAGRRGATSGKARQGKATM